MALGKATDFHGVCITPVVAIAALAEFGVFSNGARVGIERVAMEGTVKKGIRREGGSEESGRGCSNVSQGATAASIGAGRDHWGGWCKWAACTACLSATFALRPSTVDKSIGSLGCREWGKGDARDGCLGG